MRPRPVIAGACVLVTRRCFGRQFLLRPDAETVAVFNEALATSAARFAIDILGAVMMSNHYHLVVHDPKGHLPRFVGHFNALLTLRINKLRTRSIRGREAPVPRTDTLWDTRQPSCVELGDPEAVLEALAYVHLNPVAAGLIADPEAWPGLSTGPRHLRAGFASGVPLTVPPTHAALSREAFAAHLSARVSLRLRWLHRAMERLGRPFGTASDAVSTPWDAVPDTAPGNDPDDDHEGLLDLAFSHRVFSPDSPLPLSTPGDDPDHPPAPEASSNPARHHHTRRPISPTVKASTPARRAGLLERLARWRKAYAAALHQLRATLHAVFPGSTYRLARLLPALPLAPALIPAWRIP